jgi:predicted Na+-dependent transporter
VSPFASRLRTFASRYPELCAVLIATAIGLTVHSPLAWVDAHEGVDVLLAVLVFSTAITVEPSALLRIIEVWRRLLLALVAGITVLPALSWLASRVVASATLREGVLTIGLAPCEIASVATTSMADGDAALSAGVLIGSTVGAVVVAGPILGVEAGAVSLSPGPIISNLLLVVALPLAVGLGIRAITPIGDRGERAAGWVATLAVAGLVGLIAAEVHVSSTYFGVLGALGIFLAGSILLGLAIGRGSRRPIAVSLLLTTSMRDFAIAAGIATTAFGPAAAAPLGLYGILVLVWGTASAGTLRRSDPRRSAE